MDVRDMQDWARRKADVPLATMPGGDAGVDEDEEPAGLTDELLDAIAELAARIQELIAAWPPEMLAAPEGDDDEARMAERELSPEKKDEILGEIGQMPEPLGEGFKSWLRAQGDSPMSWEDAQAKASEIAEKRDIDDPEKFGAWIFWASKAV